MYDDMRKMCLLVCVLIFVRFGSALAMFMHIFGKSDQTIVVIVSNELQTTGNIASWQRTAHEAALSRDLQCRQLNPCEQHGAGLSCGHHAYNSIQPTSGHHAY